MNFRTPLLALALSMTAASAFAAAPQAAPSSAKPAAQGAHHCQKRNAAGHCVRSSGARAAHAAPAAAKQK